MTQDKIFISKVGLEPLFYKGDKFIIVKTNNDKDMMPIEAKHIRSGWIFGFNEGELECY